MSLNMSTTMYLHDQLQNINVHHQNDISFFYRFHYLFQSHLYQLLYNNTLPWIPVLSAGFPYRLNRLKPRVSKFRGPPAKMYNILNTVIWLSHLCCHRVLYFQNHPSVIFLTQLHSISEYCRILNTPSSSSPLFKLIKRTSIFLHSWRWGIGRGLTIGIA